MQPFPHRYLVRGITNEAGAVRLAADGLPELATAPPAEFGGPGDRWSPESLLVGAVVDCYLLTLQSIARASHVEWKEMSCRGEGTLDRKDGGIRFVALRLEAELVLPPGSDVEKARRLMEKAETSCLVSNSLGFPVELVPAVRLAT